MALPGYVVRKPGGAKRVLVLIHGITGDGVSSWTNRNGAYWPDIMKEDAEFKDFDIYVYQYPTSTFGQCMPITDLANNMCTHLKNDNVFSEHEQIAFLAHSMGGLVVRQFLLRNRDTVDKVPLVMFFATPTAGSWKANVASLLPTCSQTDDLRTLDVNSYLKAQQSDWLSAGFQERVISHCAFETRASSGAITVDRSSATLLCTRDPDALPTDHSDAVKPSGLTDLSHIIVRNILKDLPDPPQENHEIKKQVGNLSLHEMPSQLVVESMIAPPTIVPQQNRSCRVMVTKLARLKLKNVGKFRIANAQIAVIKTNDFEYRVKLPVSSVNTLFECPTISPIELSVDLNPGEDAFFDAVIECNGALRCPKGALGIPSVSDGRLSFFVPISQTIEHFDEFTVKASGNPTGPAITTFQVLRGTDGSIELKEKHN